MPEVAWVKKRIKKRRRICMDKKNPGMATTPGILILFFGFLPQQLSNHHADVKQNCHDYEDNEHRVRYLRLSGCCAACLTQHPVFGYSLITSCGLPL